MQFQETWPLLLKGKYVKRDKSDKVIFKIPTNSCVWVASKDPERLPYPYNPCIEELVASDWEVIE